DSMPSGPLETPLVGRAARFLAKPGLPGLPQSNAPPLDGQQPGLSQSPGVRVEATSPSVGWVIAYHRPRHAVVVEGPYHGAEAGPAEDTRRQVDTPGQDTPGPKFSDAGRPGPAVVGLVQEIRESAQAPPRTVAARRAPATSSSASARAPEPGEGSFAGSVPFHETRVAP